MQAMAGALGHSGGPMQMLALEGLAALPSMLQRMTDLGGRLPTGMAAHHPELLHTIPLTGIGARTSRLYQGCLRSTLCSGHLCTVLMLHSAGYLARALMT